jgi:hypothetical protein
MDVDACFEASHVVHLLLSAKGDQNDRALPMTLCHDTPMKADRVGAASG